jgi:NAD(P)-dependent dehydrogenase (short-subunit alcohol dehydrogenase family)
MIASGFIAQGAKVYISSRKADVCEAVADELGPNCIAVPQGHLYGGRLQSAGSDHGRARIGVDILVNNAGAAWGEAFETFPEAGWDKIMNLNVKSIFFLTQAMHGLLKAAASAEQPAKVINIASIDGLRLNPWETYSYQASKAAVINLTKRLAARLVKDSILVTGIAPGAFASEMNKAARDLENIVGQHVPAGRIGNDEDMAGVAIYLAARSGNYVIGETIAVDGGVVNAFLSESWEVDPSGNH